MSTRTDALPRTSIASICWGEVHIRNYWQDNAGGIRETQFDAGWTGGTSRNVITTAKLGTPLAAICWGSIDQIRVYYLDTHNVIQEYCWGTGSGWTPGALGKSGIVADPRSKLAAVVWGGPNIRLYYQKPNDSAIYEHCWGPSTGWIPGATLPAACPGSSLAAVFWTGNIRVYYQAPDYTLREHCWRSSSSWTVGKFNFAAPFSTPLAAIAWTNTPHIRVYWANNSNELTQAMSDAPDVWSSGTQKITDLIVGSSIGCIRWGSSVKIRWYFQIPGYFIQEWMWNGRLEKGATIPTH